MTIKPVTAFSAEELLRHSSFLRSLATTVAGRGDLAEDLTQDVWLAAMTTPPRSGWDPRRWLSGVTRNLARQFRRERRRRSRRELAAARPEAVRDTGETVARLEILRHVVDAVEQLDEPYRKVVMLRFFDGLPPREIARQLGIPVETVRTRQRRALDQLRGQLDGIHGGDRESWEACLAPLILTCPAPSATAAAGSSATTLPMVPLPAKLAAAGLAVAGVCLALVLFTDPWQPGALTAPIGDATGMLAAPAPTGAPAGEFGSPARQPLVAPAVLRVHGRVTRLKGVAYASARVRVRVWTGYERRGRPNSDTSVVADREGRFEWTCPRPDHAVSLTLDCGVRRRELTTSRELLWIPGDPDPGAIRLSCYQLDCEIAGTITGPDRKPVAGASVKVFRQHVLSDAKGGYRIRAASGLQNPSLTVFARGYVVANRVVRVNSARQHSIDVQLQPGVRVSGRVTGTDGAPIAGARFWMYWTSHKQEGETDGDGRYDLTCLDPSRPIHLTVRHPEFQEARAEIAVGDGDTQRDFVLRRGIRLFGTVVDAKGAPIPGARLQVYGASRNGSAERTAIARDAGRFEVRGVIPGKKLLVTTRRGFAATTTPVELEPEATEKRGLRVVLARGHTIEGTVLDVDGTPVAGVRLLAVKGRNFYLGPYLDSRAHSDAEGRFRLGDLPVGPVAISASGRGWLETQLLVLDTDRRDLTVTMRQAGGLAGTVVDGANGKPIPRFRIRFVNPELRPGEHQGSGYRSRWGDAGYTFTDPKGTWDTGNETLEPGSVLGIEVFAAGFATRILPRVVVSVDPEPTRLVIRLDSGSAFRGRVVDAATGKPIADASVRLLTANELARHDAPRVQTGLQVETDARGEFRFARVPAGEVRLLVRHRDWPVHVDGPFRARTPRVLRLRPGGRITGTVLDRAARPIGAARIGLKPFDRGVDLADRRLTTDARGRFDFDRVPAGIYKLVWSEHRGNSSVARRTYRVRIDDGAAVEVEMGIPKTGQRISGALTGRGALPEHCYVSLIPTVGAKVDAEAVVQRLSGYISFVDQRRFDLRGVPPGHYVVYVSRLGSRGEVSGMTRVEVIAGKDLVVDVKVEVTGGK